MDKLTQLRAAQVEVPDDPEEVSRLYYERGWSDGLPVIPPTEERVRRMLGGTRRAADEVLGAVPPAAGEATVGLVAVNAVLAGCLPEHLPVLLAAVEAMLEESFALHWIQATTHPVAPLLIVNGPVRARLGFNAGTNAFGPCNRANAAVGRAIRLILLNAGGAAPGVLDHATQGQPSKYSFCVAEHEEANPWEPLHVERGFPADRSTVTVCGVENPHNVNDHESRDAAGVLTTIAGTVATQGNNNILYKMGEPLLVLGPEHARIIADGGFSKADVKRYLFERARVAKNLFSARHQESQFAGYADGELIPVAQRPEDYMIVVAGGAGKHSAFCPSFAFPRSVTKEIRE